MPVSGEMQPAISSRSKKNSRTTRKHSTKRRNTSTIRTPYDAAKASSDDMPFIDLKSDRELFQLVQSKC